MLKKNLSLSEIFDLAVENHKNKQFKVAENLYKQILITRPNHVQTSFLLGTLYTETNNFDNAIKIFQKIIAIQPNHAFSYNNLGMIYAELGEFINAIMCLKNAIKIDPNLTNARNNLCALLRNLTANKLNEKDQKEFKDLFLILYKRNDIDHNDIFLNAKNVLFDEKNLKKILKKSTKSLLLENTNIQIFLKDDLFLLMMQKSLIADLVLERIIISIRKEILFKFMNNKEEDNHKFFNFIVSLAEQCFLNEYVYMQTENEINLIGNLENRINKNKEINELDVAILGCYKSLSACKKLKGKLINYKSNNFLFNDLLKMQIEEIRKENELKKTIKSHGDITDKISQKVRSQYEENPYPRWRYTYTNVRVNFLIRLQNQIKPNATEIKLINKFNTPNILIAGCGTGRHLLIADSYTNANILGVDLSLASLAYAKRKTQEMGLNNIEFLHSDILNLKSLKRKFDIIESVGVLHHMKDPIEGLKVLLSLLEPHGVLKLGLYSKIARTHITHARKFAKENKLKSNIEDIRKFRYKILNSSRDDLLSKVSLGKDFYTTSAVRDLIFHEQEYCFTIPEIAKTFSNLKLNFLGFTEPLIKNKYFKIYIGDKKNIILKNWIKYEKDNPETFRGMYNFWVKK